MLFLATSILFLLISCTEAPSSGEETTENPIELEENIAESTLNTSNLADNSQTSLDWPGTYSGNLPCQDCAGIETSLELNTNLTFTLKSVYLGKSDQVFEKTGTFVWSKDGGRITLNLAENTGNQYQVGENILYQLDANGNKIAGSLASRYTLVKKQ